MSVSIQDVLALLPEIFPGVQPIFLDRIRPYPDNPGPPVTEDQVQELTVPILEDGLVNPLKLRPDPAGPLVPGLSPHPDNPRLKIDGTPWRVEDFNWMILSGERRWRAFRKLHEEGWVWRGGSSVGHQASYRLARLEGAGKALIPAYILNPTEEEAVIITHTDNDVRDRGWFADYQSIEALIKVNPNLTQSRVAAGLKIDKKRVIWAISLLPLLNPEARVLIGDNVTNSNKGIRGLSEIAASELAGLGPGTGLKPGVKAAGAEAQKLWPYPAIPPETQDLVRRALAVAIDREMTQAKVKALVQWIKEGNRPEEYPAGGVSRSPAVHAKAVVAPGGPVGTVPSAPTPTPSPSGSADLHTQVGTAIASHELGKRLHLPTPVMNRLLPWMTHLFHRARGLFARVGIKNPTWATFLTLLLFLFMANFFIHFTGRVMHSLWNRFAYSFISSSPQAGGQGLVAPSQSGEGIGATYGGSAHMSSALVGPPPLPPINSSGAQAPNLSQSPALQPPIPPIDSSGVSAKSASTPTKGGDVLTQIGNGVKNYQSAVNTADQAKAATDKAKGILGF